MTWMNLYHQDKWEKKKKKTINHEKKNQVKLKRKPSFDCRIGNRELYFSSCHKLRYVRGHLITVFMKTASGVMFRYAPLFQNWQSWQFNFFTVFFYIIILKFWNVVHYTEFHTYWAIKTSLLEKFWYCIVGWNGETHSQLRKKNYCLSIL